MGLWRSLSGLLSAPPPAHGVRWAAPEQSPYPRASLYQICYSDETLAARDPAFLALDNRANLRPDWREYHPIRAFLQNQPLDEDCLYGFFSPKFTAKTHVDAEAAHGFIAENPDADVVLFSPYIDLHVYFLNSFVQGDYFHPGLLDASQALLQDIGWPVDLGCLVMDFSRSVFCNFFAARPSFWRAWLAFNEQLHARAEGGGPVGLAVTAPTRHGEWQDLHLKVFIQERATDLLLGTQPQWRVAAYPRSVISTISPFCDDRDLVFQCNALKNAFLQSGDRRYLQDFNALLDERGMPPFERPEDRERRHRAAVQAVAPT